MTALTEHDVRTPDGRTLHVYDAGGDGLPLLWHHGTPNIGPPPAPLFPLAAALGLRWLGHDRPGYGGSTRNVGRDMASTATDVTAIVDALGIDRFAVIGHSGGGANALACAALLGERVVAAVSIDGLAPYDAAGLDWLAGFPAAGVAEMAAAVRGKDALEAYAESGAGSDLDFGFLPEDEAMFATEWRWFLDVVRPAFDQGVGGMVDDTRTAVAPWGFDVDSIGAPTLVMHGELDGVVPVAHGHWLAAHIAGSGLRVVPEAGHLSVMRYSPDALTWIREHV